MQGFDEMVDRLRETRLVPFIGAGVSRAVRTRDSQGPAFPTWLELLTVAADLVDNDATDTKAQLTAANPDLLNVADSLYKLLGKTRWNRLLRTQFDRDFSEINPQSLALASKVWDLRPSTVITTNYDRVLYWTCPEDRRNDLRIQALDNGVDVHTMDSSTPRRPVLVHLHGRIEHPSTLVLTPQGYDRLYTPANEATERAYQQALFALRNVVATRSLLFIGWSASDLLLIKAMRTIQELFQDSSVDHFVLCPKRNEKTIKDSLEKQEFDAEVVLFDDFGQPLIDLLDNLGRAAVGQPPIATLPEATASSRTSVNNGRTMPSRPSLFLRRRCRSVPADLATSLPALRQASTEGHTLKDHLALLSSPNSSSTLPTLLTESLLLEFDGRIELMELQLSQAALMHMEEGYRRLYHGFALEKLYLLERAIDNYEWILRNDFGDEDLTQSARFNKAICMEKLNEFDQANFAPWISPGGYVLRNGDAIWLKAINMELIACTRQGVTSPFEDLVSVALETERKTNPGGYAKTLINWAVYKRQPLDAQTVMEIVSIAAEQCTNSAVGLLKYCYELTSASNQRRLRGAIEANLDAALARSKGSSTVRRFHTTM